MVTIKSKLEVDKMRRAGKIVYEALCIIKQHTFPGVTTLKLCNIAEQYIKSQGATPSFNGYNGFPKSVCISVNEEVIHGIPSNRKLIEGDIVSVDVGACVDGYHGDAARTFAVGRVSSEAQKLIDVTKQSFFEGLAQMKAGKRVLDISVAVQGYVEANGFSVVRKYCGHGIGRNLHEDPNVPNCLEDKPSIRLYAGMTLAVEPMVNIGKSDIYVEADGWTVVTKDKSLSAHYENTVLITKGEPIVLTKG